MEAVTAISRIPCGNWPFALIGGLPCLATYFAADLCRDLFTRQYGACEVLALNELGEGTLKKIAAIEGPVVFLSEVPDAGVADTVARSEFPAVLIDYGFAAASLDFMAAREANLLDTVRTMARAQIGLNALLEVPRSDLLAADRHTPAADLARRLAGACGIKAALCQAMIDERELERPLQEVLEAYLKRTPQSHPREVVDLLGALEQFYGFYLDHAGSEWHMPIELLLEAVPPYMPATETIDLLGPARCLNYGPYIYLARGGWKAAVTFSSHRNRSVNTIGFDVTADEEIKTEQDFEIKVDGKFSVQLDFEISNPLYPVEFRAHLRRGAIDGELRLHSLVLARGD